MSSAQIARTAYRAFAREARRMTRDGTDLRLTQPLDLRAWGSGHYVTAEPTAEMKQLQELLFPGVGFGKHAGAQKLCPEALMEIVRTAFRTHQADGGPAHAAIDASLHHLATLNRLRAAMKSTSHTLTRFGDDVAVEVEVCSAFIPSATMPLLEMALAKHFPFAYRIRVENKGTVPVQLMGRHWVFTDTAGGTMEVPRGSAGVVGQTPLLFPGQRFEYISGTSIATPSGSMKGSFQMVAISDSNRQWFDAYINATTLAGPDADVEEALRRQHEEETAALERGGSGGAGAGAGLGGGSSGPDSLM